MSKPVGVYANGHIQMYDWLEESLKASKDRLDQMPPEKHKHLEDAEAFRQARKEYEA